MRIARIGQRQVEDRAQQLDWLGRRLLAASPAMTLRRQRDGLRENRGRLVAAMRQQLMAENNRLQARRSDLIQLSPALAVQRRIGSLGELRQRLATVMRRSLETSEHRVALLGRALHSVSPLATLERGYAIVSDAETGNVLLQAE